MENLPSLIWFHNDMSPLGGAQREILTAIPKHKEKWNITFVTLNAPTEVRNFLKENNITLITPKKPWINPKGGLNEITAKTGKSQLKEWKYLVNDTENNNLKKSINDADAILLPIDRKLGCGFTSEYDEDYDNYASPDTQVIGIDFDGDEVGEIIWEGPIDFD